MNKILRFSFLMLMLLVCGGISADVIEFEPEDDNAAESVMTLTKGGITMTITGGNFSRTDNYRVFKGQTLTISSTVGNINGIEFESTNVGTEQYGLGNFTCEVGTFTFEKDGDEGLWLGSAASVVFTAGNAQVRLTDVKVYTGKDKPEVDNDTPDNDDEVGTLLDQDFTKGQGDFTIENVSLPQEIDYVWSQTAQYGMKASAYVSGTNYNCESWLISPVIDMTNVTSNAKLTIEHAINKYFTDVTTEATLWIREVGGQWQQVAITYPQITKTFSDFVDLEISLNAYCGKKIQVGFKYVGNANSAGTWEIKEFEVEGKGAPVVVEQETKFNKVRAVESGKKYALIAAKGDDFEAASQLNKAYGYLPVVDADDDDDTAADFEMDNKDVANAMFTFTAVEGGYTIQQADGKYLYQTGTYNSFNVSDGRTDGDVWTAVVNADGTFKITNVAVNKYIQLDSQYGTYGSYNEEKGTMPYLCEVATSTSVNAISTIAIDNSAIYNLAGQRLQKAQKGLNIVNGKKMLVK